MEELDCEPRIAPSSRTLRSKPTRTEAGKEYFENDIPLAKKKKMLQNKALAKERAEKAAKKRAEKTDLENRRAQLASKIPIKHTLECAPGWQWYIELPKPFNTNNSKHTYECWKIRKPPGLRNLETESL